MYTHMQTEKWGPCRESPAGKESDMNPRERALMALGHREPDRVPFDLGGSPNAGIHATAYRNLLRHLGDNRKVTIEDIVTQKARVDEDILRRFKVDFRKADFSELTTRKRLCDLGEDEKYTYFVDEWGIKWVKPRKRGLYYDMREHALPGRNVTVQDLDSLKGPALPSQEVLENLKRSAERSRDNGFAVVLDGTGGGVFEWACWIRGHQDFLVDIISRPVLAERLMRRILAYKLEYYELTLGALGTLVDVVAEGDDVATQNRLMISPDLYRRMIKPLHRKLFKGIRESAKGPVFVHFHSCGAVRELIPDLIDVGVDALNPVQVTAAGMETRELKREFGHAITFWGGGVDTQRVLPHGSPDEVRDEVRRRIDDLAPGGGFIFAAVHNIQADVPPANIMAMWEALQEYGVY